MTIENKVADTWIYDVNPFYGDRDDVFTKIQPSIWFEASNGASDRVYLQAFDIPKGERKLVTKLFPEDEWGDDFFSSLEHFYDMVGDVLPETLTILKNLPKIEGQLVLSDFEFDEYGEIKWEAQKVDNYEY
jgi:hypothetical protein